MLYKSYYFRVPDSRTSDINFLNCGALPNFLHYKLCLTVARYKFNLCMYVLFITCLISILSRLLATHCCCRTKTFRSRCRCSTQFCDVYTQYDDDDYVTYTHNLMTSQFCDEYAQFDDVNSLWRMHTTWWRQLSLELCLWRHGRHHKMSTSKLGYTRYIRLHRVLMSSGTIKCDQTDLHIKIKT